MILHLSWRYWRACRTWEWNSKINIWGDQQIMTGSKMKVNIIASLSTYFGYPKNSHFLSPRIHDFLTNMANLFFLLNSRRYKQGKTEWSHRLLHPQNLMKTVWYIDFNLSIGLKNWVSQNSTIYTIIKALFYDLIIASYLQAFIISLFLPQLNH